MQGTASATATRSNSSLGDRIPLADGLKAPPSAPSNLKSGRTRPAWRSRLCDKHAIEFVSCCSKCPHRSRRSQFSASLARHPLPLARVIHRTPDGTKLPCEEPDAGIARPGRWGARMVTPSPARQGLPAAAQCPAGDSQSWQRFCSAGRGVDSFDLSPRALTRCPLTVKRAAGASASADYVGDTCLGKKRKYRKATTFRCL
jgi:hypothetical protein